MRLSADDERGLIEEFDDSLTAQTVRRFCQDRGYDLTDEDVLDDVLSCAYQCGYRWAERDADPG